MTQLSALLGFLLLVGAPQAPIDLSTYRMVDLTHAYGSRTVYWPTSPTKFSLERLAYGKTEAGYFYAANTLCTPEHGGTHLDAPLHFAEGGRTTDQIPLEQLIAPAVVIDVTAAGCRGSRLPADARGRAARSRRRTAGSRAGTIVLLRTGWSRHWPDAKAYLGDDTPGDASKLSFPVLRRRRGAAARRGTPAWPRSASTRPRSTTAARRISRCTASPAAQNVPGLENLTNLDQLPATRRARDRAADEDRRRLGRTAQSCGSGQAVRALPTPNSQKHLNSQFV